MSFKKVYQDAVVREGYHNDGAQAKAVDYLDGLYAGLLQDRPSPGPLQRRLAGIFQRRQDGEGIKGCYLWGGVGLGKTWLMDLFFDALPIKQKSRFHFHEFMQRIHIALAGQKQQRDPLKAVARALIAQARVICLDEFHVSDITDAMLLYGLLDEMYRQGAVFIMTSNVKPDDLYLNGLQRSRFLPAIELIKQRSQVLQFEGDKDYRLHKHLANRNYYCPLAMDTDRLLEERFGMLAKGVATKESKLTISNRPVHARAHAENIVWFEFEELCAGPRATIDYIELARRYEFVIISNVHKMNASHDDIARRFINLVDEFYDRDTGLIISANAWPGDLYGGQRFVFEFERTISRLQEIRSRNPQPPGNAMADVKTG
ncbi:MAG TPA: cell division protein ZapE [Gammaproteobacteria bacterium]